MKNLQALASQESLNEAIENAKKSSKSVKNANELSSKTAFNSSILRKSAVTETAKIDFALCLLSSVAVEFHQSQVSQLLSLIDCKRTTVAKHINDKKNAYSDYLTVDTSTKIITVTNQAFFQSVVSLSEFKQQLEKYAVALYDFADVVTVDYEQAHAINFHEQAILMNTAFDAASTKAKKAKAVK